MKRFELVKVGPGRSGFTIRDAARRENVPGVYPLGLAKGLAAWLEGSFGFAGPEGAGGDIERGRRYLCQIPSDCVSDARPWAVVDTFDGQVMGGGFSRPGADFLAELLNFGWEVTGQGRVTAQRAAGEGGKACAALNDGGG